MVMIATILLVENVRILSDDYFTVPEEQKKI
jgi:hypothetical protein